MTRSHSVNTPTPCFSPFCFYAPYEFTFPHFLFLYIFSLLREYNFLFTPFFPGISVRRKTRHLYLAADSEFGHCKFGPTSLLSNDVATLWLTITPQQFRRFSEQYRPHYPNIFYSLFCRKLPDCTICTKHHCFLH